MITKNIFNAIRQGDVVKVNLTKYLAAYPNHVAFQDYKDDPIQIAKVCSRDSKELTLSLPNECLMTCGSHQHIESIEDFQPVFDI